MKILKLDPQDIAPVLKEVVRVVKSGGVVLVPTDTVYGLVCDARDDGAVRRIFEIKRRPLAKPIGIFVSGPEMARRYLDLPKKAERLLGKATLVTRIKNQELRIKGATKDGLSQFLKAGGETLGVRAPGNRFLSELITVLDFPLAQTSANVSGRETIMRAEAAIGEFSGGPAPDLALDGGELSGLASTVIDLTGPKPEIIRAGALVEDDIMNKRHEK